MVPSCVPRNYDVIRFWEDGSLLLGASDLTGRIWTGALCHFQDPEKTDLQYCNTTKDVEFGICDGIVLPSDDSSYKAAIGYDCGGIELIELSSDETESEGPIFTNTAYSCEHDDAVISLSLTANKQKIVSGSFDRSLKIWDLDSMVACATYSGAHWNIVLKVDCHPESNDLIASCARDGRVLMWDTRLPRPASMINVNFSKAVPTSVKWQPNHGMKLLIGDEIGAMVMVDIRNTNGYLNKIVTNERGIFNLEFSPWSDQKVAVCGDDTTVSVLNVMENRLEASYVDNNSHNDFIRGLAWHPLSRKLYTCSWDQSIKGHLIDFTANGET